MNRSLPTVLLSASLAAAVFSVAPGADAVASAELFGRTPYRYGKFEARVQFPAGDGVIGSFFLWKTNSEKAEVYWNELDFEKINADCTMQLNSLYGLPEASHTSLPPGLSGLCTSFHNYAFEWTPEYIAWFIDGVEVRRDTGMAAQVFVDNAPEGMIFDFNNWPGTPAFGGNFSPDILPVHEYVSYVAYSAYTPGAGDEGSDFTFTWRESFEGDGVPAAWGTGSWGSPLGQSTHSPANVNFQNGMLILSLTADDATGYSGTPPVDTEDLPTVTADALPGTGGSDGMGTGGAVGTGGDSAASGGAGNGGSSDEGSDESSGDSGGCVYQARGLTDSGSRGLVGLGLLLLSVLGLRRRFALRS